MSLLATAAGLYAPLGLATLFAGILFLAHGIRILWRRTRR